MEFIESIELNFIMVLVVKKFKKIKAAKGGFVKLTKSQNTDLWRRHESLLALV